MSETSTLGSPGRALPGGGDEPRPAPAWKLWENPIIRRYCRSRLRPKGLGIGLLIAVLIAGFVFLQSRTMGLHRSEMAVVDAERLPLIPLLFFQGIILFLLGTGVVAGGMTAESDEGVLDYQRLAPMTPLAKVLGYLFGLPIREYVLFLATMPFTLWGLWRGEVPLAISVQLYGTFITSAILYHLTGLVAGTVVKNKRWAFLVSMGIVFLLYTVIPQLSRFGLVYFKYLTLFPVGVECLPHLVPRDIAALEQTRRNLLPDERFFNLNLPEYVFTLSSQIILILTGMVMLWRRWRRTESHLMGKAWAVGLFAATQFMLLGNAIPLISPGAVFPSRGFDAITGRLWSGRDWSPDPTEAIAMVGIFGLFTLLMMWVLTLMITPNAEAQLRGWRRARKLGRRSLVFGSDPATAFWWVLIMVGIGGFGWFTFAREIIESRWFPGREVSTATLGIFTLVCATAGLGFHALLEGRGGRAVGLTVILLGVLPLMLGAIVAAVHDRLAAPATWLFGLSPASFPTYAAASVLSVGELPRELARAMPRAFWFWQATGVVVTIWLAIGLVRKRREIAAKAAEERVGVA